ncbi:MAG: ABC transporter substrate-binding protein [Microcystaceae cyanobacterium]
MIIFPNLKKLILRVIGILFLTCSLLGCSSPNLQNQAVFSILSDPKTFNAVLSAESPNIFSLTSEGLITENPITGQKEPALAQSWDISEDNKTIIFTLRENLKWSDGQPLTVDDVIFTYNDLYLNPKIPNNFRDSLRIGESKSFPIIKKLDDRRLKFTIAEPFAPFLDAAEMPILPAHILRRSVEKKDKNGNPEFLTVWGTDTAPKDLIVNGPYKLKQYATSQRLIFEKNPYYWKKDKQGQQLPHIPQVVWAIVESTDTALLQFRSGSLDSVGVSPEYFSLLKKEEERGDFTIYNGGPAFGTSYLTFNLNQGKRNGKPLVEPIKSKWFNDLNFRQAIAHSIDRERMINNIYRGLGAVQNSEVSVQSPFYNRNLKGYDYNPTKAKELLKTAGFTYNSKQELLDQEGNRVNFTLNTNAGNKIREAMGTQIQEDMGKIGIKVDFSPLSFNVLVDKLSDNLEWDAIILGLTGGNEPHAPNVWYLDGNLHMFNQKPQTGTPLTGQIFADWEKEIANLYLQGSQTLKFEERRKIYDQVQLVTEKYLPFIYLVNSYSLSAVRNRFCGIQYSALGGAFWNLDELTFCDSLAVNPSK